MSGVVLENLTKDFPGGVRAVDGVDLDVAPGEFVVLVGPSGCGKSTTLRMIAGLEDVTEGRLSIGGRMVNEVAGRDRDVAMVFQNYALYPHLTVRQNMAFPLERRRAHRNPLRGLLSGTYREAVRRERTLIDAEVDRAAVTLGVKELLDRKPSELSGGQRQRVAVGRALVRRPAVFLFDEPLSNLDAKLRVEMRAELRELHDELGATMVYVTHDQEEAMTLGDRLVVMKDGVVQQCAPPSDVYERPSNRFVAGFVGTPTMNFLSVVASDDGGLAVGTARVATPAHLEGLVEPGRSAVLGIRPDALSFQGEPSDGSSGSDRSCLEVDVRLVEDLGDRVDVHMTCSGGALVARRPRAERRAAGPAVVRLDLAAAHLFEPGAEGRRLCRS